MLSTFSLITRSILITAFIIMVGKIAYADTYNARILDADSKTPVAFASIGIPELRKGFYTDESGKFKLDIADDFDGTIVITMIGYRDTTFNAKEFLSLLKKGDSDIFMQRQSNILENVIVRPVEYSNYILGNNATCLTDSSAKRQLPLPFIFTSKDETKPDTLTEIGTLMKVKKGTTFIDSVQLNLGRNTYTEIFYRLNFYEKKGKEYMNILQEPIYIKFNKGEVGEKIVVNLMQYNLAVENDFVVSIERVKDLGEGEFNICGTVGIGKAGALLRVPGLRKSFISVPIIGMGMLAYVTVSRSK